jgi:hypothetical protein
MASKPNPPSPHGRTPWDVLLELSRRRSFVVWACVVGWAILVAVSFAWYRDLLPAHGAKSSENSGSQYLHWSFQAAASATRDLCSSAALRAQTGAGANATETHDSDPTEVLVVGVHGSAVTATGCVGFPSTPLSLVVVAAPEQTQGQNKEALLRKLFNAELSR